MKLERLLGRCGSIKALTIRRSCSWTTGRQNCRSAANADTPLSCP